MYERAARHRLGSILALSGLITATGLVAPLPSWAAPPPPKGKTELLDLLPAGTEGVLVCDLVQSRRSPLYDRLLKRMEAHRRLGPVLKELQRSTGLDPRKDLDRVVVASHPDKRTRWRGFVVWEGTYDGARLRARLAADKRLKQTEVLGRKAWSKRGKGGPVFDVVLLDSRRIAFSHPRLTPSLLRRAGLAPKGPAEPRALDDKAFAALLRRPDHKAHAWFAGRVPPELKDNPDAGPLAHADALFGTLNLGDALQGTITGVFRSEQMAQQLAAALMLLKPRLVAHPQVKALGLTSVVQRLQAAPAGKEAQIALTVSEAELGVLADRLAGRVMGSRRPKRGAPGKAAPKKGAGAAKAPPKPAPKPASAPQTSPASK